MTSTFLLTARYKDREFLGQCGSGSGSRVLMNKRKIFTAEKETKIIFFSSKIAIYLSISYRTGEAFSLKKRTSSTFKI
jgi:hypothetical protein